MPTEQYHEPPEELSQQTRTLARMRAAAAKIPTSKDALARIVRATEQIAKQLESLERLPP